MESIVVQQKQSKHSYSRERRTLGTRLPLLFPQRSRMGIKRSTDDFSIIFDQI